MEIRVVYGIKTASNTHTYIVVVQLRSTAKWKEEEKKWQRHLKNSFARAIAVVVIFFSFAYVSDKDRLTTTMYRIYRIHSVLLATSTFLILFIWIRHNFQHYNHDIVLMCGSHLLFFSFFFELYRTNWEICTKNLNDTKISSPNIWSSN